MTVKVLFILLGILLVITLLGAIAFMIKSKNGNAAMKSAGNTLFTCSGCIIIATAILCILCFIGTKHGMYDYNISVPQLITSITNTPEEDTLPDDLHNTCIIYYRFTCDDCEAIYDDLRTTFLGYSNVYWISTRSPQGKALTEQYPVSQVPSAVYIDNNGLAHTYLLMTRDSEGTYLDTDVVNRINELMQFNQMQK